ncbi:unnamed protein product [Amoebophrya sp. A25]|nr:unnamed protein product [Amoebophrya sp. A25]|eukprot:GSA25T00004808001.1
MPSTSTTSDIHTGDFQASGLDRSPEKKVEELNKMQPSANASATSASATSDVHVVSSPAIRRLMSFVRDAATEQAPFVRYSNRVMRILVEEALSYLPHKDTPITTACGVYSGKKLVEGQREGDLCGVSIMRSGNCMLEAVREVIPDLSVGHILVQRDETDPEKKPIFYYKKFPEEVERRTVLLCDPMLATGGSAIAALKCLVEDAKVKEEKILFAVLIAAPEGVKAVKAAYPKVTLVTAELDEGLNAAKYIVPGLGDFGDRYYDTA